MKKKTLGLGVLVGSGACALFVLLQGSPTTPPAARTAHASASRGAARAVPPEPIQRDVPTETGPKLDLDSDPESRTLVRASWGSGVGQLGRSAARESNPEAPASLTVDSSGRIVVLDKVNGRVVRYDRSGRVEQTFPIPLQSPQELVVASDGSLLVMDRLVDQKVAILEESGRLRGELPLVGEGLEDAGSATGLFSDRDGVYVESEHSQVYRIGNLAGIPDTDRVQLDGRPSRDGRSLVSARLLDRAGGRFMIRVVDRATGELRLQKQVVLRAPLLDLVFLDTDSAGTIYAGAHVGRELAPGEFAGEALQVACLDPNGEVEGVAVLPANTMADETFRDLSLRDDGTLIYMERSEDGLVIREHRCS